MDLKLHILSELSESLLDHIPQSIFKVNRRLPHIHALLNKYMKQKSHLLPQSEQKTKEFLAGTSYNPSNIDILLNKLAVEAQHYEMYKEEEPTTQNPEELVEKYKKLIVQSVVDRLNHDPLLDFKNRETDQKLTDWNKIKERIVEARGKDYFTIPSPKKKKQTLYTGDKTPQIVAAYNAIISKIFHAKLTNTRYQPLQDLILMEQKRGDIDRESFETIWRLISAQLKDISSGDPFELAISIMSNTTEFFEQMFAEQVLEATHNISDPSMLAKITAYSQAILESLPAGTNIFLDNKNEPAWMILYFLLRSGLKEEAIKYCENHHDINWLAQHLTDYFRLREILDSRSISELVNSMRDPSTLDVYQRAVLILLAKMNTDVDELQQNTLEDYLWFKLKIAQPIEEAQAQNLEYECENYNVLVLSELQRYLIECGPQQFENQTIVYTIALISTMCYGEAIQYLYSIDDYNTEAIHLAVILNENSMLPIFSSLDNAFEVYENVIHVNLNKIISDYIKIFESVLPNEALMYISLMTSTQGIVSEASNLVISFENYQIVLNDEMYIFSNKFKDVISEQNYRLCVEAIADYAARQKAPEAVVLYDLVENYEKVLETWIFEIKNEMKKLSENWKEDFERGWQLKEEKGQCEMENYVLKNYQDLYEKYRQERIFENFVDHDRAIQILEQFLTFYNAVINRQFHHALAILSSTSLFPIRPTSRQSEIQGRFKRLHFSIKEEIPNLIVTALQVHQILLNFAQSYESNELKNDMKELAMYYGEANDLVRGIPSAEQKFKELGSYIREVKRKLALI
ncbi:unnamed protein product [Blepharisma stoltei]|uniref:Nuclear pore protein n=1 Tax=Blepharisma stoltei TaxID=1481888 RepID=A0AAU9IDU1_9CILI|nr:unnamed protein product [Blepharisma stoltei]